jgi:aspartate 1-decarboxylase
MQRIMLKSKIWYASVTETQLYYKGSITIDEALMQAADVLCGEKVEVLNLSNGSRIETYAIKGKKDSGVICLNGPAARTACVGDKVIIVSYGLYEDKEAQSIKAKYVELDAGNKIKNTSVG